MTTRHEAKDCPDFEGEDGPHPHDGHLWAWFGESGTPYACPGLSIDGGPAERTATGGAVSLHWHNPA